MDYKTYIRSPEWYEVRSRYRASKLPQTCKACGETKVELHHKTYKRLGRERLTDLVPLCRKHHQQAHDLVKAKIAAGGNPSKWNLWSVVKKL